MRSEDYITELLWKSAHVFPNSTQIPSVPLTPILYGGGGLEDLFSDLILPRVVAPTPGPWVPPVVRQSTPQVGSSTERQVTAVFGGVSETFVVPSLDWNEKALATEISETSSFGFSMAETDPIQIQPAMETETETETADDWKLKERKENVDEIEKTKGGPGSTPRKRSRAAEMHNLSEKKRREKISDKMKSLQELIPHCNTSDKASMLEDVIAFVQWSIQLHRYMSWNGMMQMMYTTEMQRFMPHMNMGMNIDFPMPAHIPGQGPLYPPPRYPFPKGQQPDPAPNQPQFPGHLNPNTEFVGLYHMQQRHHLLQNQTKAQLSFSQGSSTSELEGQKNQRTR